MCIEQLSEVHFPVCSQNSHMQTLVILKCSYICEIDMSVEHVTGITRLTNNCQQGVYLQKRWP